MPRDTFFQKPSGPAILQMGKARLHAPPSNPHGILADGAGQFRISVKSPDVRNFGAGVTIASVRWTADDDLMVIKKLRIGYVCTVAFTTPQLVDVGAYIARGFQVGDSDWTVIVPSVPNTGELDSQAGPSAIAQTDGRIASLLPVTAGVRTLDAQPFMTVTGFPTATAGVVSAEQVEWTFVNTAPSYPIVLRCNEGIVVNLLTAMGAAGRMAFYFDVEWDEVAGSRN